MKHFILADNQALTRYAFHGLIKEYQAKGHDVEVNDVSTHSELVSLLRENEEAIVVLDWVLLKHNQTEELMGMIQQCGKARWILSSNELPEKIIRQVAHEPHISIVLKDAELDELRQVIQHNLHNDRYLSHAITKWLLSEEDSNPTNRYHLTHTEIEILKLIASGKSVKEMATERISSIHTITTHKKNIFRKLRVKTSYEATKYALRVGLVDLVEYYI